MHLIQVDPGMGMLICMLGKIMHEYFLQVGLLVVTSQSSHMHVGGHTEMLDPHWTDFFSLSHTGYWI